MTQGNVDQVAGNKKRSRIVERRGRSQRQVPHCGKPHRKRDCSQQRPLEVSKWVFGMKGNAFDKHENRDEEQSHQGAVEDDFKCARIGRREFHESRHGGKKECRHEHPTGLKHVETWV